jgi:hypothetical protein
MSYDRVGTGALARPAELCSAIDIAPVLPSEEDHSLRE